MKIDKKYQYLLKNTMLFSAANLANKLIVFILLPFYTAYLTAEEYAVIDLITITQQLVFPFITLDMTEAVVRFGMEKDSDRPVIFSIGFIFVAAGNLLLITAGCAAAGLQLFDVQYIVYFVLFSAVVSFNTLLAAYLRTLDRVHVITIASIVNTAAVAGLNIWLTAGLGLGIFGYFASGITGNVLAIMIMAGAGKIGHLKYPRRKMYRPYLAPMLRYAVPMIPNAVFWWINSSLDRYFLTMFGTLASVGMYAAANKIPSILVTVTSIFQQAWSLSRFREQEADFFAGVFKVWHRMILAASALLILAAKPVCRLLLGGEFFDAWVWVPWLILGFYSNAVSSFIGTEFTAAKRTSWIVITTLISAIVNVVLNCLLIPGYGGLGAALATCISYFVLCEIRIILLKQLFKTEINHTAVWLSHAVLIVLCFGVIRLK